MTGKLPAGANAGSVAPTSTPSAAAAEKSSPSAPGAWHVFTCDGQRFGPITKEELDRWVEEKRLTGSCQVYQDGWPTWRMARELYANLPPAAATASASAAAPNVGGTSGTSASQNPYAAPMFSGSGALSGAAAYQVPHRG